MVDATCQYICTANKTIDIVVNTKLMQCAKDNIHVITRIGDFMLYISFRVIVGNVFFYYRVEMSNMKFRMLIPI